MNSLIRDWNRGRKTPHKGQIRIIAEQLLRSINLVLLQKIICAREDHKQGSAKLETKKRGAECACHC